MFIIARDEISMSEITVTNKECPLVLASIMLCNQTRVTLGAFYRQPNHTVTEINELLTNITSCTTNGQSELIIGTYQEFYGMTGQSLMMCQVTDWK